MTSRKRFTVPAFLAVFLTGTGAWTTEIEDSAEGVYFIVGGGTNFYSEGLDEGTRPIVQLGAGYAVKWLALEATLFWTDIEWLEYHYCIMWVGAHCPPTRNHGDLLGGIVNARFYFIPPDPFLRFFIIGGVGGHVAWHGAQGDVEGTALGVTFRAGGGAEIGIVDDLKLDVALTYSNSSFDEKLDYDHNEVHGLNMIVSVKFSI
jgi:opacity protein-like surface antigen